MQLQKWMKINTKFLFLFKHKNKCVLTFFWKQLRDVCEDELHHDGLDPDLHEGRCTVKPRRLDVLRPEHVRNNEEEEKRTLKILQEEETTRESNRWWSLLCQHTWAGWGPKRWPGSGRAYRSLRNETPFWRGDASETPEFCSTNTFYLHFFKQQLFSFQQKKHQNNRNTWIWQI